MELEEEGKVIEISPLSSILEVVHLEQILYGEEREYKATQVIHDNTIYVLKKPILLSDALIENPSKIKIFLLNQHLTKSRGTAELDNSIINGEETQLIWKGKRVAKESTIERYIVWQKLVDKKYKNRPNLSLSEICVKVAIMAEKKEEAETIRRNTSLENIWGLGRFPQYPQYLLSGLSHD